MSAMTDSPRHFLDLSSFSEETLSRLLDRAAELKATRAPRDDLRGKTLALVFEKPSTRTRVSFELAMKELGGFTIVLSGKEMQLGHGESLGDTARVLGRYVHAVMIRTFDHAQVQEFARGAPMPVINGLTNFSHPCQVMADLLTVKERLGALKGRRVVWMGDGDNNVLTSWIQAGKIFGFTLTVCCPKELAPKPAALAGPVTVTHEPGAGLEGAEAVLTDTWISMHNADADRRRALLEPYRVDEARMKQAGANAMFMHCLPAHRGEEVTGAVMDGPQSAVWDEAENRLHAQKAILLWCFGKL